MGLEYVVITSVDRDDLADGGASHYAECVREIKKQEESGYRILDDCSVVTAPYRVDDDTIGVLGVIGPTRMAYDRVVPIVDITARLLETALSHGHQR